MRGFVSFVLHPSAFILLPLADFAPHRRRFGWRNYDHSIRRQIGGCEQHSLADFAAHGARGEVGYDDDLLADQLLGLIVLPQPRADLPLFRPQVDLQNQQLIRIGMGLAFQHRRDAQLKFGEIVVLDQIRIGHRGRSRRRV